MTEPISTTMVVMLIVICCEKNLVLSYLELPQLSDDIDGKTDVVNYTSLTVSFGGWNQLMIGGEPPDE